MNRNVSILAAMALLTLSIHEPIPVVIREGKIRKGGINRKLIPSITRPAPAPFCPRPRRQF